MWVDSEVRSRLERLEIPFSRHGYDQFGISKEHLGFMFSIFKFLYRNYFSVTTWGIENVPPSGRTMLVGNHSGGVAIDGMMIIASLFLDSDPPRLAQGMAEKFLNRLPFCSLWTSRLGHLTGLPEHAVRLLEAERMLMVFPEGAGGTAKLYKDRYTLVKFGTGFMRLALQTKTPVVPLAFVGGGEAIPTVANLYRIGKILGLPYLPVTPYLVPLPKPTKCHIVYGEPMSFEGTGNEEDEVIRRYVGEVKTQIASLIEHGRRRRDEGAG